jgi:tryptophan-rich sensory protein
VNWSAVAVSVVLCVAMAAAEGMLTNRDFPAWLKSLKRPRLYAPLWVWVTIAVLTYALQGFIAYRLVDRSPDYLGRVALSVLVAVMAANVAYNVVLDRTRQPAWAYRGLLWYVPLLIALQALLFLTDPVSALLNLTYVAWVVAYDMPMMHSVARLNE